jgi:hypothetical protein
MTGSVCTGSQGSSCTKKLTVTAVAHDESASTARFRTGSIHSIGKAERPNHVCQCFTQEFASVDSRRQALLAQQPSRRPASAKTRAQRPARECFGFLDRRRRRLVGGSAVLNCLLTAGSSSPGTGGTSGARLSMRSTSLGSARRPRSARYSTVSRAAAFSATAVAINWLMEMSSCSASSRILRCRESGSRRLKLLTPPP